MTNYYSLPPFSEFMRIEYVTVQPVRRTASLEFYKDQLEDNHNLESSWHKEYESIIQRRTRDGGRVWAEWP